MKKGLSLIGTIITVLSLGACNSSNTQSSSKTICNHEITYVRNVDEVLATCTDYATWIEEEVCRECGEVVNSTNKVGKNKADHQYENGTCKVCSSVDKYHVYNSLGKSEKMVFDALMINIYSNFSNPSSVRLQGTTDIVDNTFLYIKINNVWYQLYVNNFSGKFGISFSKGYLYRTDTTYTPTNSVSVEDINEALDFYWSH